MATNEKFCLKWNDFEHNVSSAFNTIREEKDFFDVTLVCDNKQVEKINNTKICSNNIHVHFRWRHTK